VPLVWTIQEKTGAGRERTWTANGVGGEETNDNANRTAAVVQEKPPFIKDEDRRVTILTGHKINIDPSRGILAEKDKKFFSSGALGETG
jgi:hypothetical protein